MAFNYPQSSLSANLASNLVSTSSTSFLCFRSCLRNHHNHSIRTKSVSGAAMIKYTHRYADATGWLASACQLNMLMLKNDCAEDVSSVHGRPWQWPTACGRAVDGRRNCTDSPRYTCPAEILKSIPQWSSSTNCRGGFLAPLAGSCAQSRGPRHLPAGYPGLFAASLERSLCSPDYPCE